MNEESAIKIRIVDLHKSFGGKRVLCGVNLEVREGESMVVIGGSGSGKTVLIKCIIGLMPTDQGEIYVDGKQIRSLDEKKMTDVRKKFGMLFQGGALFDSLTVWENVGFGLQHQTPLKADAKAAPKADAKAAPKADAKAEPKKEEAKPAEGKKKKGGC